MHAYRTHTCGALRAADAGQPARLSGWVHAKRDHGGLLFIDLRDHYGITQCVFPAGSPAFAAADAVRPESVITVTGQVVRARARHGEPAAADRRDRTARQPTWRCSRRPRCCRCRWPATRNSPRTSG